jgi:dynein heavy chain
MCSLISLQEVITALGNFSHYSILWEKDRDEDLAQFLKQDPKLSEYEGMIRHYEEMESEIKAEPEWYDVGAIALYTGEW